MNRPDRATQTPGEPNQRPCAAVHASPLPPTTPHDLAGGGGSGILLQLRSQEVSAPEAL